MHTTYSPLFDKPTKNQIETLKRRSRNAPSTSSPLNAHVSENQAANDAVVTENQRGHEDQDMKDVYSGGNVGELAKKFQAVEKPTKAVRVPKTKKRLILDDDVSIHLTKIYQLQDPDSSTPRGTKNCTSRVLKKLRKTTPMPKSVRFHVLT